MDKSVGSIPPLPTRGRLTRIGVFLGNHAVAAVFALLVALVTPFVTRLVTIEDGKLKSGDVWDRIEQISAHTPERVAVSGEGDGATRGLIGFLDSVVAQNLVFADPPQGLRVRYRLSGLTFAGTSRQVTLQWQVGLADQWVSCGPRELRFASNSLLGAAVADALRHGVQATISGGNATCG